MDVRVDDLQYLSIDTKRQLLLQHDNRVLQVALGMYYAAIFSLRSSFYLSCNFLCNFSLRGYVICIMQATERLCYMHNFSYLQLVMQRQCIANVTKVKKKKKEKNTL